MSQIHIGTFRETCKQHGCPGCTVTITKAPQVDEVTVTMGLNDWEQVMRLVRAAGLNIEPSSEFYGTFARIVAADNASQY